MTPHRLPRRPPHRLLRLLALGGAVVELGLLGGCIPVPTIRREPEPRTESIAWRACTPIGHALMLDDLTLPQGPLYNPRQAADLRDDLLETWRSVTHRYVYAPDDSLIRSSDPALRLSPADATYWMERWLTEGAHVYPLHLRMTGAAPSDAETCLRQVQAGLVRNEGDRSHTYHCRSQPDERWAAILREGLAWRAQWSQRPAHPPASTPNTCP